MKIVYVVGSFKDLGVSRKMVAEIEGAGFKALISNPGDPKGIDGCLERIEMADAIYVSNPRGDIGKSVSLDIGYALARKKPVFSMLRIDDPPISHHIKPIGRDLELLNA